jgi:hypothetical protein
MRPRQYTAETGKADSEKGKKEFSARHFPPRFRNSSVRQFFQIGSPFGIFTFPLNHPFRELTKSVSQPAADAIPCAVIICGFEQVWRDAMREWGRGFGWHAVRLHHGLRVQAQMHPARADRAALPDPLQAIDNDVARPPDAAQKYKLWPHTV